MSTILAYVKRDEPGTLTDRTPCACGTIIVGEAIVRRVGSVTHGALCCIREDESDEDRAFREQMEDDARIAEREALSDWESDRGSGRGMP